MATRAKPKKDESVLARVGAGLDSGISAIMPQWGARRALARVKTAQLSAYHAADRSRIMGNFMPRQQSADSALQHDQKLMRNRSRDLMRNEPFAVSAVDTTVVNSVGTGITPQSQVDAERMGLTEDQAREFQRVVERAWRRWARTADSGDRLDFERIQFQVLSQILEGGDVFVLRQAVDLPHRPYLLAAQVVEADRVDTPAHEFGGTDVRMGVRLGERGEAASYFVNKNHPGDSGLHTKGSSQDFDEIPARDPFGRPNVIHLYHQRRPGQTRGIPFLAPVVDYLNHLGGYYDAELTAARAAACVALFITSPDAGELAELQGNDEDDAEGRRTEQMEPGLKEYLLPGERVEGFDPKRPNTAFDAFTLNMIKAIAAPLGLPYELLVKDFSNTNYSSAKAALNEARRFFKVWRRLLVVDLNQPFWELLIEEMLLRGELPVFVRDFYAAQFDWTRALWIAPGWGMIEPLKETNAHLKGIDGKIVTYAKVIAEVDGGDWEGSFEQSARELAKLEALGMTSPDDDGDEPATKNDVKEAANAKD